MTSARFSTTLKWTLLFLVPILVLAVASPASAQHVASHAAFALPSLLSGEALLAIGALAPVVDSIDTIPENARGAYVQKDGKYVLDADIPDVSGLRSKNSDLVARLAKAQERAALLGERTAEEIQADLELAKTTREKKAKAEGDFESLKAQLVTQHKTELEKVSGRTKKVESKLYDVMARRELEAAIVSAGGNPKVLLPHMLPFVKVIEQDEDFSPQVVDEKGKARIAPDGSGKEMSIAQLVETFKADETFGVAFKPSDVTGSGARNSSTPSGSGAVIIPKDADVQTYRRMKADAEKRGVPDKVAE